MGTYEEDEVEKLTSSTVAVDSIDRDQLLIFLGLSEEGASHRKDVCALFFCEVRRDVKIEESNISESDVKSC